LRKLLEFDYNSGIFLCVCVTFFSGSLELEIASRVEYQLNEINGTSESYRRGNTQEVQRRCFIYFA